MSAAARPGTRLAAGLLLGIGLATALAPVWPLPDPATMAPDRAQQPPAPRWRLEDETTRERRRTGSPLATAVREGLFGPRVLGGALGTDTLGRDVAARVVWGGRVSLQVGLLATLVAGVLGTAWGLASGWRGGRTDQLMMRLVDVLDAVPLIVVVILLVALLRERAASVRAAGLDRLVLLFLVIGATSWLTLARLVRGQVRTVRERPFVEAARALGAGPWRLVTRHVLPQVTGVLVVALTLTVPRVMLFESFLSFLGLGVEPPAVSWGLLASQGLESLTAVSTTWWLVAFPGGALAVTLGCLNHLGDALRDHLDPRIR